MAKYKVARSFSKKVQVVQFAPEDFHAYHEYEFDEMPTTKEIAEKSKELWLLCKEEVLAAVKERAKDIRKGKESDNDGPY